MKRKTGAPGIISLFGMDAAAARRMGDEEGSGT